jgi:hypothetical protein
MSFVDRLRQPAYTGENRCIPCTITNVTIAGIGSTVIATKSRKLGGAAFAASLGTIHLRGYLVPGTSTRSISVIWRGRKRCSQRPTPPLRAHGQPRSERKSSAKPPGTATTDRAPLIPAHPVAESIPLYMESSQWRTAARYCTSERWSSTDRPTDRPDTDTVRRISGQDGRRTSVHLQWRDEIAHR